MLHDCSLKEHKFISDLLILRIVGNTLEPDFKKDDLAVIQTGAIPQPGDYVAVIMRDEKRAVLKRYVQVASNREAKLVGVVIERRRFYR